jgi:hypothetical protein
MKAPLPRRIFKSLHRFNGSTLPRFNDFRLCRTLILVALLSPLLVHGQSFTLESKSARSISGQFTIYGPPQFSLLAGLPKVAADTNFVRLEPALLAVSAERIKVALWRQFEIKPNTQWRGQIYLVIHPARSLDESVNIIAKRLAGGWDYRVELPDVVSRTRFMRALAGVVLLELANRTAQGHSAEVPEWLVDGLAQELLAAGSPEFILSTPDKVVNRLPVTRINVTQHGLESLTAAQRVLQHHPPLTFEQLSWPTGPELDGNDAGVYRASAQVFVSSLLELKNGTAQMRALLESLPQFYNWQTAFRSAFRADFPTLLDVEKWWALQVAGYAVRDPGPLWTPAASRARLDELLSVPMEVRANSNSLPAYAQISLQNVIRSEDHDRQTAILQSRLRDLELAQYRMSPQYAVLAGDYRQALANYLGETTAATTASPRQGRPGLSLQKTSASLTSKKLDELDARRRQLESGVRPEKSIPPAPAPLKLNLNTDGQLDRR